MKSKEKKVLATPELLSEMENLKVFGGNMPDETQGVDVYCPNENCSCPPPPPTKAPEQCNTGA